LGAFDNLGSIFNKIEEIKKSDKLSDEKLVQQIREQIPGWDGQDAEFIITDGQVEVVRMDPPTTQPSADEPLTDWENDPRNTDRGTDTSPITVDPIPVPNEPVSDIILDEQIPAPNIETTIPLNDTTQAEVRIVSKSNTPEEVGDEVRILGDEASRYPDDTINKIAAKSDVTDPLNALANRIEKRKDIIESPLRMMSDEELESELTGFLAHNSLDPQISTEGSNKKVGDFFTLMQWGVRKDGYNYYDTLAKAHPNDNEGIDDPKNGMPLYFKDLRDGAYIFFRAYIDGDITDNFSSNWTGETYIGRSEQVWTYTHGTREIQFKIKLVAQSKDELDALYEKLNRLTSLCYPEYKKSQIVTVDGKDIEVGSVGAKERMKPPLTKLRLGELFGDIDNELTGFVKSVNVSFPSTSPWETKRGKRVPKYIDVDIGYQPIHSEVPSLNMAKIVRDGDVPNAFYGVSRNILKEKKDDLGF
jgi:hypothetical protein